jgi:uncharacterized protein (DUF1800 family)
MAMPDKPLLPLDRIDPVQAWESWEPGPANPWNLKWAGHLYRRAGFGPSLAELRQAVNGNLSSTLDRLLQTPDQAEQEQSLTALGEQMAKQGDVADLRGWWMYLLLTSPHSLHEKMTLFWHNHFATSIAKVQRTDLMFKQNQTLRRYALGKFRPFLLDMSRDPAMLIWLDSNSNIKGKANENYARELMELFALGVGHYTEKDVREAARAFTGWHTDGERFEFNANFHDSGEKTLLGQKGGWDGGDVVRIVLDRPESARFLVRKLYRYFISESASPPPALLEPLAESFRKSDYDVGGLIKTILRSRHFFSDYAYRQRIKSPVEFVAGTTRALVKIDKAEVPPTMLASQVGAMGQPLFEPPTVKGWAGGRAWLNSATVLARNNFAQMVASGNYSTKGDSPKGFLAPPLDEDEAEEKKDAKNSKPESEPLPNRDLAVLVQEEKATTPEKIVDLLVELLFQGEISPKTRAKLISFVAEGTPKEKNLNHRIRETCHAIMTMPEYQLA